MTDQAWVSGMGMLEVCCRDRDLDADMKATRSRCYREDLDHLTDRQWLYAVSVARKREWFPSIDELLEFAASAPPETVHRRGLPAEGESARTPQEAAADAVAGLARIREELGKAGIAVRSMRLAPTQSEWEERKAKILAQAKGAGAA